MPHASELDFRAFDAADLRRLAAWLRGAGLAPPRVVPRAAWGRRLLEDPRIVVWSATLGPDVVGFVRLDLAPDRTAEITLIVDPRRRRRGIGRALLERAVVEARRRGLRRLFAVVANGNDVGHKFFLDSGFDPSGSSVPGFDHLERFVHRGDLQTPLEIFP